MGDDALSLVFEVSCKEGGHDTRGGAGKDDLVISQSIQLLKHLSLEINILRHTLLQGGHSQLAA